MVPQLIQKKEAQVIFSSRQDGSSFNRLCHSITGYASDVLILFRSLDQESGKTFLYGVYAAE
jgi:hypothetical protein